MARHSNEVRSITQAADHLHAIENYVDFALAWSEQEIAERRRIFDTDGEARLAEMIYRTSQMIKHVKRAQQSLEAGRNGDFVELPVSVSKSELLMQPEQVRRICNGVNRD